MRYDVVTAIALATAGASCSHPTETRFCQDITQYRSFVPGDPYSIGCVLKSTSTSADVVQMSVFGLDKPQSLGDRLRTLERPASTYKVGSVTWYVFQQSQARLEAGCVEARSLPDETCIWHLYAYPPESGGLARVLHPDLIAVVEQQSRDAPSVKEAKFVIERPPLQESVAIYLSHWKLERLEWIDPKTTSGFVFRTDQPK